MKTAMIRKALLPVLAASAVMVSTPALAQNFSVSLSFGSPGYSHGYGYAPRDLHVARHHFVDLHGVSPRLGWMRWKRLRAAPVPLGSAPH